MNKTAQISGKVVEGNKLGRTMGFPTINIDGDFGDLGFGVYACEVFFSGKRFYGAMHYGPRFTVGKEEPRLEILLLDFDGDLYGETVTIDVYNRVRGVRKFADLEALKKQIEDDVSSIREMFNIK